MQKVNTDKLEVTADPYPSELYNYDEIAPVLQSPDAFNHQALEQFKLEGYLAVASVYSPAEVEDAKQALDELIAKRYEMLKGDQLEFSKRSDAEASKIKASISDAASMLTVVRKLNNFTNEDTRLAKMLNHPTLVRIVEALAGEKVVKFQEMALLKPPKGREKPWHQDHAYFDTDNSKHIVGVWIALDEATIANGCMHIMPGKHHEPVVHFARRDWQICDTAALQIKQLCLAVPLKPGGVLFFDSFLPHGTPTNHTNLRRRALQLHFKPVSASVIKAADRMAIWGSEGKDVAC